MDQMFEIIDLRSSLNLCDTCEFRQTHDIRYVPFELVGPGPYDILFVAESPGHQELRQERPLIGPTGTLLREELARLSLKSYGLANVVSCHPRASGIRTPQKPESEYCVPHVHDFIKRIKPKVVVLLGGIAMTYVVPESYYAGKSVTAMSHLAPIDLDGIHYAVAFHPSYVHRGGGTTSSMYGDWSYRLKELIALSQGHTVEKAHELEYGLYNLNTLEAALRPFVHETVLGFDYETRLLDAFNVKNRITGFSISSTTYSSYVEFDRAPTSQEKRMIVDFLREKQPWTYNSKFETNVTLAMLGEYVEFNDAFVLCKIDCQPYSLKNNARKYLGANYWEEDLSSIVENFDKIFKLMTKRFSHEVVKHLFKGDIEEAARTPGADKLHEIFDIINDLRGNISEDEIIAGLKKFPYQWEAVPQRILGEYCCYDSYYTVLLRLDEKLWKYKKQYEFYLNQTKLAGIMESYGLHWDDLTASRHDTYYKSEAIRCLGDLILNYMDVTDEQRILAKEIVDSSTMSLDEQWARLKGIFNPLSPLTTTQAPFWRAFRTPYAEITILFQHIDIEIQRSLILLEEELLPLIDREDFIKTITAMTDFCVASDPRKEYEMRKIIDEMLEKVEYYFSSFRADVLEAQYQAHVKYGNIHIDCQYGGYPPMSKEGDKDYILYEPWTREFTMIYLLRRYKKVVKSDSAYIWGKTGRGNVNLARIDPDNLAAPPVRIAPYMDLIGTGYELKENERWIMNSDFFECSAATKRWRSRIHCALGNTLVQMADYSSMSMEEIFQHKEQYGTTTDLITISYDHKHQKFIPHCISDVFLSGYVTELVEVTLENGKSFKVTPNHRLLMSNGEYIEAQYITDDTDLMDVDLQALARVRNFYDRINYGKTALQPYPFRGEEEKFHYFYCTVNTKNGKVYFGVRTTHALPDNYLGSGTRLWNSISKHGEQCFEKRVIKFFMTVEEMIEYEALYVTEEFVQFLHKFDLGYNLRPGGHAGWYKDGVRTNQVMLENGTHPWIKTDETGKTYHQRRAEAGQNPFQWDWVQQLQHEKMREMARNGTHVLTRKDADGLTINHRRVKDGTHPFMRNPETGLSLSGRKVLEGSHHWVGRRPWEVTSATPESLQTWYSAHMIKATLEYYNQGWRSIINWLPTNCSGQACREMCRRFTQGWDPYDDEGWVKWRVSQTHLEDIVLVITSKVIKGPWNNANSSDNTRRVWYICDEIYLRYVQVGRQNSDRLWDCIKNSTTLGPLGTMVRKFHDGYNPNSDNAWVLWKSVSPQYKSNIVVLGGAR